MILLYCKVLILDLNCILFCNWEGFDYFENILIFFKEEIGKYIVFNLKVKFYGGLVYNSLWFKNLYFKYKVLMVNIVIIKFILSLNLFLLLN